MEGNTIIMYGVNDFEAVKKRCRAFWAQEFIGRPFCCLTSRKKGAAVPEYGYSYVNYLNDARKGDYLRLAKQYAKVAESMAFYGEALPSMSIDLGPDQYAAFYGGEIIGQTGEYTTWVHSITDLAEKLNCTFDPNNHNLKLLLKLIEEIGAFAKGKFLLNMLDLHSNMDTLSALLGPQNLCYEVMDNPDTVIEKLKLLNADYPAVYNTVYKALAPYQSGSIGWQPLYSERKSAVVQCDFSCMLSPDDARRFVIPSIEREVAFLDDSVYHYDGKGALGHMDDILAVKGLNAVQWVPGDGSPRTIYWMDLLKKIQKAGKSVWIYDWSPEEIMADKELDPRLTLFSLHIENQDEAQRFMEKLEKKYR